MKPILSCLIVILSSILVRSANVTFSWDPQDDPAITNYTLWYGTAPRLYTNTVQCGNVTSFTVSNLLGGVIYYFNVSAQTSTGLESPLADEAAGMIPAVPVIVTGPTTQRVPTGATVNLDCVATGPDLTWTWLKEDVILTNSVAARLTLYNVTWRDNGVYSCIVTNIGGSVKSNPAQVSVIPPPTTNFKKKSASQ